LLAIAFFAWGFGAGARRWPPYEAMRSLWRQVAGALKEDAEPGVEAELFGLAFTEPLAACRQIHAPVKTLDDLERRIDALSMPAESLFGAFEKLDVLGAESLPEGVLEVRFRLEGYRGEAHAFAPERAGGRRSAALVIPGSGRNVSSAIRDRDRRQPSSRILDALDGLCDAYVFIKPNEDCLAIHDGRGKLEDRFLIPRLLNRGASYSATYLVQSLALMKHLQSRYPWTGVVGVSQGGEAALYHALEARPAVAVIASGYSVLLHRAEWKDLDQVIVPGLAKRWSEEALRLAMAASGTRFLLTWGEQEDEFYRLEARERLSAAAFRELATVRCLVHAGGHELPVAEARAFIEAALGAPEGGGAAEAGGD
jgi:hypothetical protein